MKKTLTTFIFAATFANSASAAVIVGYEQWDTPNATVTASGLTATWANESGTIFVPQFRGSSDDGTFGSVAGAESTVGTDASGHLYGARASNTQAATISFTITDTSGVARPLNSFHFDAVTRHGSLAHNYTLSVASGDLTNGIVATGTIAFGFTQSVLEDNDIPLTGLADNILDANGTVTFHLAFTRDVDGRSLDLDNVGVIPEPSSSLLLGAAALAVGFRRRRS